MSDEKKLDQCESEQSLSWKATHVSPMAKEVKIGVSVIFVLLVVFGIAPFNRLKGSDAESTTLAAEKGPTIRSGGPDGATTVPPQSAEVVEALPGSPEAFNAAPNVSSDGWGSASPGETSTANTANQLQSLYMPDEGGVAPVIATAGEGPVSPATNPVAWETEEAEGTNARVGTTVSVSDGRGTGELAQSTPRPLQPAPLQPVQAAPRPESRNPAPQATISANGGVVQANPQWDSAGPTANDSTPPASSRQSAGFANHSPPVPLDASPRSTFKASQPTNLSGQGSSSNNGYGGSTGMQYGTQALVENETYVVQPNDNYWIISERVYGTGAFFQALAEHNRDVHSDENWLRLGEKISVPSTEELEKLYPALCPTREHRLVAQRHASAIHTASHSLGGRVYTVQEGDSLFDIARHELGRASRYGEIIRMNQDVLGGQFDYLTPGMQLVLPEVGRSTPSQVTNRPRGYQR